MQHTPGKVTHTEIAALIRSLQLPQTVSDLFAGTCTDAVMKRYALDRVYTDPYKVLDLERFQQEIYLVDRYKPLLACVSDTIFAYDTVLRGYITYSIESKVTAMATCLSWDGLFITEIRRWWEQEISDEDILHIGGLFGLHATPHILNSIYETTDGAGFARLEDISRWEEQMIVQIHAQIS